ncbi:MAG: hypothetical protein ABEN55_07835, partial [Bradymonadaceae bacterium]
HYFSRNIRNFIGLFGDGDEFAIDDEDRVIREMMVTRDGEITWPPPEFEDPSPPADDQTDADAGPESPLAEDDDEDETSTTPI